MDNIRIYLISLVVLHHVAIGYGGAGSWPITETPTDGISPILFFLFNAVNQSYFMSFFYLLSGYFLPRSYDKKGPAKYLTDRFTRLGIPVLINIVLIAPLVRYIVLNFARGKERSFFEIIAVFIDHRIIDVGPLWFVEGLLIFSVIYILYRIVKDRFLPDLMFYPFKDSFPTNKVVALSILAIALGTFVVRIFFPVGVQLYHFQLGHFVHYIFCFWLGILAYRGKWFENLSEFRGRLWGKVALVTVILLPIFIFLSGSISSGPDVFLGGFSWQAFVCCAWESIACLSIIIWLLYLFQKKFYQQGRLLRGMSLNAYTVYIIHQLIIIAIMALFIQINFPTPAKFFLVALIGVPLCFTVSHFIIRKIPYSTRVLG